MSIAVQPATPAGHLSRRVGEVGVLTLWAVFVGLTVVDLLTTLDGLSHHLVELNPLARMLLTAYGVPGLFGYKLVVLGGVLWAARPLSLRWRIAVFFAIDLVMWAVVLSNLSIISQLGGR